MLHLKSLYLRNFRNFEESEVHFSEKCNVIHGENAQGKTNLLEAIILLSTGRSFRTTHLFELIREGAAGFYLEAELLQETLSHRIQMSFDGKNKKLRIDSNTHTHFNPLLGLLPSVLYAPQGSEIIIGAPAERRRFLDIHLAQSDPLYVYHLLRFYRAMKQRNCLLRQNRFDAIECWEIEMVQAATFLQHTRQTLISELQPILAVEGHFLSQQRETHGIVFRSAYPSLGLEHAELLKANRKKDQERLHTTVGPHRDDLLFSIDGKSARLFASEGQRRTALAALKLAEWKQLAKKSGTAPLFAIDDLSHSLDEKREELFCQTLEKLGQVFITTPHDLSFDIPTHKIEIKGGKISECFSTG